MCCYCKKRMNLLAIIEAPYPSLERYVFIFENNEIHIFKDDYRKKEIITLQDARHMIKFYTTVLKWQKRYYTNF